MTGKEILLIVCNYFDLSVSMALSKTKGSQSRDYVDARFMTFHIWQTLQNKNLATRRTLQVMGLEIGGRDHATVMNALKEVDAQLETNKSFKTDYNRIYSKVVKEAALRTTETLKLLINEIDLVKNNAINQLEKIEGENYTAQH